MEIFPHGGIDSGAIGNNLQEKDLTLKISTYIFNRLEELGIPAIMTRTDDEYLPKRDRVNRILSMYNNDPNTIIISNHINAGGSNGAEVVYSLKSDGTLANMILDNLEDAGQKRRKAYQRRLPEDPSKDYYYIIRETGNAESVLIEYGFIDNKEDAKNLVNNLDSLAEATVKALANYIGVDYTPPNSNTNTYIVKKGDSLYSISKKFNISVEDLIKLNNLKSTNLQIGDKLLLNNNSDNTYQVKRGDTLYDIAKKYNTTISELKALNNLDSDILSVGQTLLLPKEKGEEYDTYIVQKGDSLWLISRKFNIPVNKLIEINNLDDLTLQVGQALLVPKTIEEQSNDTYIVKSGDTLWKVANELNLSVDELKNLNNLKTNLLSIGQKLKTK